MRTNFLKLLLPLITILGTTNIFSQWSVTGSADDYFVAPYCQIVEVTFQITNNDAAGNMTGVLEFSPNVFDIIDYSDLPSASLDVVSDPDVYKLSFDAGLIGGSTVSKQFHYKIILKASIGGSPYYMYNRAYFDSDPSTSRLWELEIIANYGVKPVNGNAFVSDILDLIDIQNVVVSLLPLEPLSPNGPEYACNPDFYQSLFIEEKLTFDVPEYCLHNDALNRGIIIMGSGSEIVVEDGATLLIDGLDVGSCHEMWKGIYVKSGGTIKLKDCAILNAQYGIRAEKGAIVQATGTYFIDNYIGIYIPPDPNPGTVGLSLNYNYFTGTGNMLPPYLFQFPSPSEKPFAGIYASDLSVFRVPGSDVGPAHQISGNHFSDLTNGIIVKNSNTYIGDQTFTNILPDNIDEPNNIVPYEGYGILVLNGKYTSIKGNIIGPGGGYGYHFNNCQVGIHCKGGHMITDGMTMNNVNNGIELTGINTKVIRINNNTINAKSIGILSNQNVPVQGKIGSNTINIDGEIHYSTGIELNDIPVKTFWEIYDNTISIIDGINGIDNKAGNAPNIHNNTINVNPDDGAALTNGINLFGTKWPKVNCNLLSGDFDEESENFYLGAGINIDGSNSFILGCNTIEKFRDGIKTSSESTGDNFIRGNTFRDLWAGLHYGFSAVTGEQGWLGNIWDGDYYYRGAIHEGLAQTVILSPFLYTSSLTIPFGPPSISAATTWFSNLAHGNFLCESELEDYCIEGIGSGVWAPSWDSLDLKLTTQNLGLNKFDNSMTWKSRFWIFRRLHDSASLPSGLSTFMSNNRTSSIGLFSNAHDSLAQAFIYSGNLKPILEVYPDEMDRIFSDIAYYDSLIIEGFNGDSLNALIQAKYDTIYILESNYLPKDSIITSVLNVRRENAIDYIESIETDSIWEDALKFTLLEYLNTSDDDTLANSADIYDLALSCPDKYGDAVYYARSLIRKDSLINYFDDDNECAFLAPRSSQANVNTSNIFPNPGDDFVEIHSDSEIGVLNVYDLSGLRLTVPSTINSTSAYLNTTSLSSGVYIVRVKSKFSEIQVFKMIIVH